MIRQQIFDAIREQLANRAVEVGHVDLWNHNVEFIEQESAWSRPAVFVEFSPIVWQPLKEEGLYRSRGSSIKLHIVTDWNSGEDNTEAFRMSDIVASALVGLEGDGFGSIELLETHTNHNHEDIVETIEVLSIRLTRIL